MILRQFDFGWGPEWRLKQRELAMVHSYLAGWHSDQCATIIINSTWYGEQQHQEVLTWLDCNEVQRIALVSMIDAAIPQPDWFDQHRYDVQAIGYYPGQHFIDYWCVMADEFMQPAENVTDQPIDRAFLCYNRKPHWHRVKFFQDLERHGALDLGLVSMGSDHGQALRSVDAVTVPENFAPNAGLEQHGISNDLFTLGDARNWHRSFLCVVTETVFDIASQYFVSEKIYKPILGTKPFLVYASDGAVSWLEQRGFETFVHDFSDVTDLDLGRPENIAPGLVAIAGQGAQYWRKKQQELAAKCRHNLDQFQRYARLMKQKVQHGSS